MWKSATLPHTQTRDFSLICQPVFLKKSFLKLSGSRSQENCLSHTFQFWHASISMLPAGACLHLLFPPLPFACLAVPETVMGLTLCHRSKRHLSLGAMAMAVSNIFTGRVHTYQSELEPWTLTREWPCFRLDTFTQSRAEVDGSTLPSTPSHGHMTTHRETAATKTGALVEHRVSLSQGLPLIHRTFRWSMMFSGW